MAPVIGFIASVIGPSLAAAAVTVGAALLLGGGGGANAGASQGGSQTKWKADPMAGIPYVMGRTLTSGNIIYKRGHGDNNKFLTTVTALSLGPIESLDATYMNKTTVTFRATTDSSIWNTVTGRVLPQFNTDGTIVEPVAPITARTLPYGGLQGAAEGTYANYIWQAEQLGACPEPVALGVGTQTYAGVTSWFFTSPTPPPGWTTQHKLSGLAAVMNTFAYDGGDNGLTAVPQPAWIIHGVQVYDPRLDSTYPGGSGPCRALDETTYVWSDNPHLHALTWALGRWQNGKRVAGIGYPVSAIDVAAYVEGANLCDARGWTLGGQIYTRPDTPWNSLKAMLQAGGAQPAHPGGRLSCINRAPRVALATITRADLVGRPTFSGTQPRRSRINGVIAQYRSEAHDWEVVPAAPVIVSSYVTMDGDERTKEISYPLVQDVNQVAQLAAYDICDSREAGPGSVPLKPEWMGYRLGDCLNFQPEPGFAIKVLVTGRSLDPETAAVTLKLRGETDGKHAFALGQVGTAPSIASLTYDGAIAAPTGDWSLAGATLTDNGTSIPAVVLTGEVGNIAAEAAVVEYRVYTSGLGDADGWIGASVEQPTLTRKEITGVTPGTQYQVSVRYRVRGVLGARAIFGPVVAGDLLPVGYISTLIRGSHIAPAVVLTGHDSGATASIMVANHTRYYSDRDVSISGASAITGLAHSTRYDVYYDDLGRAGGAITAQAVSGSSSYVTAQNSTDNPGRHYLGYVETPTSGGIDTAGYGIEPVNGTRTARLVMYQWSATVPTLFPVGDSIYTWLSGGFTAPATANGWSISPPAAASTEQVLYAVEAVYTDNLTVANSVVTWPASPTPYPITPTLGALAGLGAVDTVNLVTGAVSESIISQVASWSNPTYGPWEITSLSFTPEPSWIILLIASFQAAAQVSLDGGSTIVPFTWSISNTPITATALSDNRTTSAVVLTGLSSTTTFTLSISIPDGAGQMATASNIDLLALVLKA